MLAQCMHRLCQVGTLFLDLLGRINDLLVQDLVAIGEISHACAKNHRVLVHIHSDGSFLCHELDNRLAILRFLEYLVRLGKLLVIVDLQEVIQTDGRFKFLASCDRRQESGEVFLPLRQKLLRHLVRLYREWWDQDLRELGLQDAPESVEVAVFALNTPTKWLRCHSVHYVVAGEETTFAHFRVRDLQYDFPSIQGRRDDFGRRCTRPRVELWQRQIFLSLLLVGIDGFIREVNEAAILLLFQLALFLVILLRDHLLLLLGEFATRLVIRVGVAVLKLRDDVHELLEVPVVDIGATLCTQFKRVSKAQVEEFEKSDAIALVSLTSLVFHELGEGRGIVALVDDVLHQVVLLHGPHLLLRVLVLAQGASWLGYTVHIGVKLFLLCRPILNHFVYL